MTIHLFLLIVALCCFVFAAWQSSNPSWNRILAVGFVLWVAALIFAAIGK